MRIEKEFNRDEDDVYLTTIFLPIDEIDDVEGNEDE